MGGIQPFLDRVPEVRELDASEHPVQLVGEETSIPIPQSDDGVEALLQALQEDRAVVDGTNIEDLEMSIDEAVYDLFDLDEEERQIIEDYLDVF